MPKPKQSTYGLGSISFEDGKFRVRIPIGKRKYKTVGRYPCSCPAPAQARFAKRGFETCACGAFEKAKRVQNAALITRGDRVGGITFRQLGDAYMLDFRGRKSERTTNNRWQSIVLRTVPFADWPVEQIDGPECKKWLKTLRVTRKARSIRRDGQRLTIELDELVGWQTQVHALTLARLIFGYGIPEHLTANPTDGLSIAKPHDAIDEGVTYLSGDDVEKLCSCVLCLAASESSYEDEYDIEMLARCPHLPFEKRAAFVMAVHQCPREGELAGMNWERVDWRNKTWRIAQSWERTPKAGKARQQELLPRAEMFLRKWWALRGKPTLGVMFPATHPGPRAGAKRAFVRTQADEVSNAEVVDRAKAAGLALTVGQVADYRAKDRARVIPVHEPARYKEGYDWGWADHPEQTFYRLGWWRRLRMSRRVRFHDMRDTAATHLLSGTWGRKWTIEEVSKFLGHSSIKVTQERYASLTTEARLEAARLTTHGLRTPKTVAQELPAASAGSSANSLKSLALPGGFEPPTNGLGSMSSASDFEHLQGHRQHAGNGGQLRAETLRLAREFLEAFARGEACDPRPLALAVLAEPAPALAAKVLSGGPHEVQQARELAAVINGSNGSASGEAAPVKRSPRRRT